MNIHHGHFAAAVRLALGAALLTAGVAISRSASADEPDRTTTSGSFDGSDVGYCSASGSAGFGRQNAMVYPSPREPTICLRVKLGGRADSWIPDCWKVARTLGCETVVDVN